MHRTGVAGERDTPRDLGCQWIKKASQKPLDDLDTRGAHKAFRLQLEYGPKMRSFQGPDGNQPATKRLNRC